MASKQGRIPVPISQRLRRLRYRLVPLLTFGLAVAGTIWLWGRQTAMPNAIGAVDAVRYDLTSPIAGILIWEGEPLDLFAKVDAHQVIARLDDAPIRAELAALKGDLAHLRKEVAAEESKLRFEENRRKEDVQLGNRRMAIDLERIRLTLLDRKAELETERITLQRRDEQLAAVKRLVESTAATEVEYLQIKLDRDVAAQRVTGLEQTIRDTAAKFAALEQIFSTIPESAKAEIDAMLSPLREAVVAQEARVEALEAKARLLVIKAPVSGTIAAIHRRPGQPVNTGDPIITIADPAAGRVISYVRADQRIDPRPGMEVIIRSRIDPRLVHRSQVRVVGAQMEMVPPNQLRSHTVPEWGLPISIDVPADARLRPGEVVELVLVR